MIKKLDPATKPYHSPQGCQINHMILHKVVKLTSRELKKIKGR